MAVDFKPVRGESKYQLLLLHSTFNEVTQPIQSLGRKVDNDTWHYLLSTKLDVDSQKAWELKNEGTECFKFDELMTFLDYRVRSMEMLNDLFPPKQLHVIGLIEARLQKHPYVVTQVKECHAPWACSKFKDLSAKDKQSAIAASKSCQNCLRFNHEKDQCSSQCRCKTCQGKHHTFLKESFNATPGTHACILTQKSSQMTILRTARGEVIGTNKQIHNLRALLDTRAHINAVTGKTCKTLGLEPKPFNERIIGVNQKDSMPVDGSHKLAIIPKTGENITLNCVVLKTITASENPNQLIRD